MLDRLERADRDPELPALLRVPGGHVEHALREAALLGCSTDDSAVEGGREHVVGDGCGRAPNLEHAARAVDRRIRDQLDRAGVETAGCGDDDVGRVGPGYELPPGRDCEIGSVEQGHAEGRGLDDRLGCRATAGLLEDQHEIDHREPEPPARLGREHADHAHLRELVPEPGNAPSRVRPSLADVRGRALLFQELTHRVAKRELVVGESEPHGQRLGIPSTRSAITLRWISFVPA